jgi:hypothetical protein
MGARNRLGMGLSYRPSRLHRLSEFIPFESIPGLHERLKIRAQVILLEMEGGGGGGGRGQNPSLKN